MEKKINSSSLVWDVKKPTVSVLMIILIIFLFLEK